MDQSQKKSYKLIWIAGASVIVFLLILGGTFYLVAQSSSNDKQTTSSTATQTTSSTKTVPTKADVQKNIDNLDSNMKQAASDQTALDAALNDGKKQIKVGS